MSDSPADPPGSTWPILPHTRAKLGILRHYLNAWFPILALGNYRRLVYVDGFAGPGRYDGGEDGSPIVALNAVLDSKLPSTSMFEFHFVEPAPRTLARLRHEINQLGTRLQQRNNISVCIHERTTFAEAYRDISARLGSSGQVVPTFALLDPFGWTGVPFEIVRDLLGRPSTEVVVNFMHDEIRRFLGQEQQPKNFDALFGCSDWRDALPLRDYRRTYRLHDIYRRQLLESADARFVRSFSMVNDRRKVDYFLFFATRKLLGLQKMKEAMWRVDPSGEFNFSDATDPNAPSLFGDKPDLAPLRTVLARQFNGPLTPIEQVFEFTIADTPFLPTHARSVLKNAEAANPPTIEINAVNRRRGTFPPDRGIAVRFI